MIFSRGLNSFKLDNTESYSRSSYTYVDPGTEPEPFVARDRLDSQKISNTKQQTTKDSTTYLFTERGAK